MVKDKSAEDTISEQEYTMRMKSASSLPENDSPGDSESDAGAEFGMGLEYEPDEKYDPQLPSEDIADPLLAEGLPKDKTIVKPLVVDIPEASKVISSEQPSPWMDNENPTSTH